MWLSGPSQIAYVAIDRTMKLLRVLDQFVKRT
jgi:hypothetical protein